MLQRRQLVLGGLAAGTLGLSTACASWGARQAPHVVVVGGGFGGATAAKYIRQWSDRRIDVTLVEPNAALVSCPLSNLVIGGSKSLDDITRPYDALSQRYGIVLRRERATAIDPERRRLRLASGAELGYDRLVLSPGVDFIPDTLPGLAQPGATDTVLHAWKAGPQTQALRQQLLAMPDGGVFAICVPLAPYRCPPGPYERACLVAQYFSRFKPRSKVLILDENEDVSSKAALFKKAWRERYQGLVEYRPLHKLVDVDAAQRSLKFEFQDDIQADVLNVLPAMRAGQIAVQTGLATANKRWCEVDFLSMQSTAAAHIHVLGDAIQTAALMPKSGHMANQHGKTCAAAVVAMLQGDGVNPMPIYSNACYSFVGDEDAIHVASVHRYDAEKKTMLTVPGSGGLSLDANPVEGRYALAWARAIWADMLA